MVRQIPRSANRGLEHSVASQWFTLLGSATGIGGAGFVIRQLRLWAREHERLKFARYVFDHTRSTGGLDGYTKLVAAERWDTPSVSQRKATNPDDG
jgi:hypothetical protein